VKGLKQAFRKRVGPAQMVKAQSREMFCNLGGFLRGKKGVGSERGP